MQLSQGFAQLLELGRVHREQPAEHHLLHRLESRQRNFRAAALVGDGVADLGVGHLLDGGGEKADFAGAQPLDGFLLGREDADAVHLIGGVRGHHADAVALFQLAVDHPHQHDHAEIGIVPGIDQQSLQGRVRVALGGGELFHHRFQHAVDVQPGLGRNRNRVGGIDPDHVLDLLADAFGLRGRQIHLVEQGHDVEPGIDRLIDIGEGLRLHALARVHHQKRAFAGGKAARDLIGKIHMARRVHEVENIVLAV